MTATAHIFGHPVRWSSDEQAWCWDDAYGERAYGWGGVERPCPLCHKFSTPEGYDPCLGYIPGAVSVCCGHGVTIPNIEWETDPPLPSTVALRLVQSEEA